MNQLIPAQTVSFLKRFCFAGGSLRQFRIRNLANRRCTGELALFVTETASGERVRMRIVLDEVEEYRFQRRPATSLIRLKEVRLGVFDGTFYFNLDAFVDDAPPALHDFRASDAYIAARSFAWEITPPKSPSK